MTQIRANGIVLEYDEVGTGVPFLFISASAQPRLK